MKLNIIAQVINAGYDSEEMPDYLLRKVKASNITTLVLVFTIAIPFVIISLIYLPPLFYIPLAGGLTGVGVIITNFLGGFRYSRLFISTLPVWQVMAYNAFLSQAGEPPVSSLFLVSISFLLAPFVMFDLRERAFLIVSLIVCAAAIVSFPLTNRWFELDYDPVAVQEFVALLETGWLSHVTAILSILCAVGSILGLAVINHNSEKESENMRKEAERQKASLQVEKSQREEDLIKLQSAQAVERKRQWAAEGVASLSDILRSRMREDEMYDNVVAMVVKYLQANQGGLYVVSKEEDNSNAMIELASCYAYGRKKYLTQSFAPGQGLLGQAYLEGETIYMTDIPQHYVKITSGLGEATPNALLIVPLKVNESTEGILELASFKKFEQHEIEFVNKLGENIAAHIQNNRVNTHTRVLLEQAQEQAELLRSQEEEMRQNMEELAATQEEMQRKEQEYQRLIQELETRLAAYQ